MFEQMFRPCGVMINAQWVHAGSSGMPEELGTPQAGDAPASTIQLLCVLEMGKNLEKLPTSCWVGERRLHLWGLWLWMGL